MNPTRTRRVGRSWRQASGLVLLVACHPADPPAKLPDTDPADSDPAPADTDRPGPIDTDPAVDTAPPVPPGSWGEGLVDVSGLLATDFAGTFQGDPDLRLEPATTTLLVGDVDEDGRLDAYGMTLSFAGAVPVRSYRQAGGVWEASSPGPFPDGVRGGLYGLIDVDGDGHLDLIGATLDALVRHGRGDGSYEPGAGVPTPDGCPADGLLGLSPWDVDADGWLDWVLARSCPSPLVVARATGPRTYALADAAWADGGVANNMEAVLSYQDGATQVHLLVAANTYGADPHPGWLAGPASGNADPALPRVDLTPASAFWRSEPETASARITELAAMGAIATDMDDDGRVDVLVTLGRSPIAAFQGSTAGFVDRSIDAAMSFGDSFGFPRFPWSLLPLDLDQDGRKDVLAVHGDDAGSFILAQGAPMRPTLWWSAGNWRFQEVGEPAGLGLYGGWHTLASVDLGDDGDADLIVGGFGSEPHLLENRVDVGHHGLSIDLVGTTSNRLAVGAVVEVDVAGLPTQRFPVTAQGNLQVVQAPHLFVGLGTATVAAETRITWPSGWTQRIPDLAAGTRHTLVEPWTVQVPDADRSAPADGQAVQEVWIAPRAADGAIRPGAMVTLRLVGAGTVVQAPAWSGTGFRARIQAPSAPGEARVEVSVDGVPVPIRPRLTWTPAD